MGPPYSVMGPSSLMGPHFRSRGPHIHPWDPIFIQGGGAILTHVGPISAQRAPIFIHGALSSLRGTPFPLKESPSSLMGAQFPLKGPHLHSGSPYLHTWGPILTHVGPISAQGVPHLHSWTPHLHSWVPHLLSWGPHFCSRSPHLHSWDPHLHTKQFILILRFGVLSSVRRRTEQFGAELRTELFGAELPNLKVKSSVLPRFGRTLKSAVLLIPNGGGLDNFPKINKRGGPNKVRGGWTKSEKLINVPPLPFIRNCRVFSLSVAKLLNTL